MKKRRKNDDEVNYWESMADSMVGLILCILLVVLLLVLFLVQVTDENLVDIEMGDSYEVASDTGKANNNKSSSKTSDNDDSKSDTDEPDNNSNASGGGSGRGDGEADENYLYEDPDPGAGNGDGTDKAAVLVQLVDGETGKTIKKSGLEFELYGSDSSLKVLSTYYPKKIDYSSFKTDESGTFYLPERIPLMTYSLHEISTLKGYDLPESTEFSLDQTYDWSNPYVVSVIASPSKNTIRMELKDGDDGSVVTGASFQVVAAENIITQDGTMRYKEGNVAEVITLDENGYGETKELYLGNYLLRQEGVPDYYGKITTDKEVTVENKADVSTPVVTQMTENKTAVVVTLMDALYDTVFIKDGVFALTLDDGTKVDEYTTDAKGRIEFSGLKKNTTYHLQQTQTISDYQLDSGDYSFTVNGEGLIDGAVEKQLTIKNRMIRVSIELRDKLLRGQISDVNIALYNSSGVVVETWNTTGMEKIIEGLKPGKYKVIIAGNEKNAQTITVEDKTDLQLFSFDQWTAADIGAILGLGILIIGFVLLFRWLIIRRREKKLEEKEKSADGTE